MPAYPESTCLQSHWLDLIARWLELTKIKTSSSVSSNYNVSERERDKERKTVKWNKFFIVSSENASANKSNTWQKYWTSQQSFNLNCFVHSTFGSVGFSFDVRTNKHYEHQITAAAAAAKMGSTSGKNQQTQTSIACAIHSFIREIIMYLQNVHAIQIAALSGNVLKCMFCKLLMCNHAQMMAAMSAEVRNISSYSTQCIKCTPCRCQNANCCIDVQEKRKKRAALDFKQLILTVSSSDAKKWLVRGADSVWWTHSLTHTQDIIDYIPPQCSRL